MEYIMDILSSIDKLLDLGEAALVGGIDHLIEWGELWVRFSLDHPQLTLIGGWFFFLWWNLRWERAFPRRRDAERGFFEGLAQIAILALGCIIWPFLALGKFGPQEAIFKIFSWKPTRFILKALSLGT